jgi:hypothetical protein
MSFIESTQKPKLVEEKMIERINKVQKLLVEQNITCTQQFTQQLYKKLSNFIIKHIGCLIVILLLTCLLYFRYSEVQEKKKKLKKILNNNK